MNFEGLIIPVNQIHYNLCHNLFFIGFANRNHQSQSHECIICNSFVAHFIKQYAISF